MHTTNVKKTKLPSAPVYLYDLSALLLSMDLSSFDSDRLPPNFEEKYLKLWPKRRRWHYWSLFGYHWVSFRHWISSLISSHNSTRLWKLCLSAISYMQRYGVSLRSQSECRKIRTRNTPNTDTFTQWWPICCTISSNELAIAKMLSRRMINRKFKRLINAIRILVQFF